jgi:hypothetical protein
LPVDEPLAILANPAMTLDTSLPVDDILEVKVDDSAQYNDGFSDLFKGIFDDDGEREDDSGNWAIDVLIAQSNGATLTPAKRDDEAELEVVTEAEGTEKKSDQDYWF